MGGEEGKVLLSFTSVNFMYSRNSYLQREHNIEKISKSCIDGMFSMVLDLCQFCCAFMVKLISFKARKR